MIVVFLVVVLLSGTLYHFSLKTFIDTLKCDLKTHLLASKNGTRSFLFDLQSVCVCVYVHMRTCMCVCVCVYMLRIVCTNEILHFINTLIVNYCNLFHFLSVSRADRRLRM